jgi:arylsulfatase A-like enzyme
MAAVDAAVGRIVTTMERRGIRDAFDIFFISDHGHSTIQAHNTLREYLIQAARDLRRELPPLVTASDYIYATPGTSEPSAAELAPLVEWLQAQPWCDIVLAGREDLEGLPGVLALRAVWNGGLTPRRPLLAVSPRWTHDRNEYGIPGTVAALTTQAALKSSHGSTSPYDMHPLFIANGPSFRAGLVTDLPTGAIDLAPTVLALLGLPLPDHLDGRILWEGLANAAGEPGEVQSEVLTPRVAAAGRDPRIQLERVGTASYLHGSLLG